MTLYEIDKAILDFEFEVDEESGEILNASELDELQMARDDKIEGISLWIKNLEAEKEAIRRGCHHVHVDTMSWQAPKFYEKQTWNSSP